MMQMYTTQKLGTLEEVPLREIWPHEAHNFTNWLAQEENIELLSNELNIDIEVIDTEVSAGKYRLDILARSSDDETIVIENQLKHTNHDHLGKIITYASGLDATTIIWIVEDVEEEHRQAVNWLNEHLDDTINIFLCKLRLFRIGDSPAAPKFQVICEPNNWSKAVKKVNNNNDSEMDMIKLEYWTKIAEYIREHPEINLKERKPLKLNYYNIKLSNVKKSLAHLSLKINTQKKHILTQIWIKNNNELFEYLFTNKETIEEELGFELFWRNKENNKSSTIVIRRNIDSIKKDNWDEYIKWHIDMGEKFNKVFAPIIKEFENEHC